MPDLEDLVRRTLHNREVAAPAVVDLFAGAIAMRRRRRRTHLAVAGTIAVTALAVATPTVLVTLHHSSAPGTPSSTPVTLTPSPLPATAEDRMFAVPAPLLLTPLGPAPAQLRPCAPKQIRATADLRYSPYGTVGVVQLHGDHCGIAIGQGPTALLGADGQRLDVALATGGDLVGSNVRPDLAFAVGDGGWGFALTGSWCGPAPVAVVLPLTDSSDAPVTEANSLTVPLTGPTPACTGTSDLTLTRGAPGRIGEAVLPAPPAWHALRASLHLPDHRPHGHDLTLTLTNSSDTAVALDPCPLAGFEVTYSVPKGSPHQGAISSQSVGSSAPLCGSGTTVPALGQLTIRLPDQSLDNEDPNESNFDGTIEVAIAGGIAASAKIPPR